MLCVCVCGDSEKKIYSSLTLRLEKARADDDRYVNWQCVFFF